jgi:hypothetical protein
MHVAQRDIYTDITEGLFLLQLPYESQLLASAGSSSSLMQSRIAVVLSLHRGACRAFLAVRLDGRRQEASSLARLASVIQRSSRCVIVLDGVPNLHIP